MKAVNGRVFGAGLAVCLLSASAWAQDGLRSASLPERNLNPSAPADQFRVGPRFYSPVVDPRFPRDHRRPRFPRRFGLSPYGSYVSPWAPYDPAAAFEQQANGYLEFQVEPATAEVRVDGFYVGNVDDVRRMGGRALEPGPHRIELRAAGFETVTFDVLIVEGETVFYRKNLEASARPATPPAAPGVPKTFYVIPGCYAGDRPPQTVRLPPSCDAAKARAIPPQVSAVRVSEK